MSGQLRCCFISFRTMWTHYDVWILVGSIWSPFSWHFLGKQLVFQAPYLRWLVVLHQHILDECVSWALFACLAKMEALLTLYLGTNCCRCFRMPQYTAFWYLCSVVGVPYMYSVTQRVCISLSNDWWSGAPSCVLPCYTSIYILKRSWSKIGSNQSKNASPFCSWGSFHRLASTWSFSTKWKDAAWTRWGHMNSVAWWGWLSCRHMSYIPS